MWGFCLHSLPSPHIHLHLQPAEKYFYSRLSQGPSSWRHSLPIYAQRKRNRNRGCSNLTLCRSSSRSSSPSRFHRDEREDLDEEVLQPEEEDKKSKIEVSKSRDVPQWLSSLGFTKKEALAIIQGSPTVRKLDGRIDVEESIDEFFRHGFTNEDLRRMMKKEALVLVRSGRLARLWAFFEEYDMTQEMFVRKVVQQPTILKYSVENVLKPGVQFFLDSDMTKAGIQKILMKRPATLVLSVKENLEPTVRYYENLGLSRADVMRMVSIFPALLQYSVESNAQRTVDTLKDNGLSSEEVAIVFRKFPGVMSYSIESKVLPLIYFVREVGGSEGHVRSLLTTQPNIVGLSLDSQIRLKFWVASDVLQRPLDEIFGGCRYFTYSLEDRILFRLVFYMRRGVRVRDKSLALLFNLSEKLFEKANGEKEVEEFKEEWNLLSRTEKIASIEGLDNPFPSMQ